MAKAAKTEATANVGGVSVTATSAPKPVQLDCTPAEWDRCHRDLHRKLKLALTTCHETGDVGVISKLVADIRALDLIEATRVPPAPAPVPVLSPEQQRLAAERKEQQDAADDPVKMQAYNAKIARKEAIDAARAEE